MTKVAEITMSGRTPISGHARVLGGGAHRAAELGVVDEVHQAGEHHRRGDQDDDLHRVDHRAEHVDRLGGQQDRVALDGGLPDDHRQRLQQQAHAHGGDQRRQARCVAQRAVGHLLDGEVQDRAHHDRAGQRDQQEHPAGQARAGQQGDHRPAGQGPDHQHLTVGEVDQVDDAVDHRVAQCHQRVHAAEHQTVDDLLDEGLHRGNLLPLSIGPPLSRRRPRRAVRTTRALSLY
jgi:hypothetical protein